MSLTLDLSLLLSVKCNLDAVYIEFYYGNFDYCVGIRVLRLLRMIRMWVEISENLSDCQFLFVLGMRIFETFPASLRLEPLRFAFDEYFQFRTCESGYGAAAA